MWLVYLQNLPVLTVYHDRITQQCEVNSTKLASSRQNVPHAYRYDRKITSNQLGIRLHSDSMSAIPILINRSSSGNFMTKSLAVICE